MTSSYPAPGRSPQERALRRLNMALLAVQQDRAATLEVRAYVDFSELHAYAFGRTPDSPDDFLAGSAGDYDTAVAMLQAATYHTFNGWSKHPLGMLPPHRSELARELHNVDRHVAHFEHQRRRLADLIPDELKYALSDADANNVVPPLLNAILHGGLNQLCNDLLCRERDVVSAGRSVRMLRDLLQTKALVVDDDAQIQELELPTRDVVAVEQVLDGIRPGTDNFVDARALVYLRLLFRQSGRRVVFVSRASTMRRALSKLTRSPAGADWREVSACLRVPECILLDFLAGSRAEGGDEWLQSLGVRIEHFLAQLDRARQRQAPHETEITETVERAWKRLNEMINLRRATRPEVSSLLRKHAEPDQDRMSRLIAILGADSFRTATREQTSRLLRAIERREWSIALEIAGSKLPSKQVVVSVRSHDRAGRAVVEMVAGVTSMSLEFVGPIREWLERIPEGRLEPSSLIAGFLAQDDLQAGSEGSLLVAAMLGTAGRWEDAIPYCDQAIEPQSHATTEALYCRAICLRQMACEAAARGLHDAATLFLQRGRTDIETCMRDESLGRDPRYSKELGTIVLAWLECGLPRGVEWNHELAVHWLETAYACVSDTRGALSVTVLNNLCYAYATGDRNVWLDKAIKLIAPLENRVTSDDLEVRDTILFVRGRHAQQHSDLSALQDVERELALLISDRRKAGESGHVWSKHHELVKRWREQLHQAQSALPDAPRAE